MAIKLAIKHAIIWTYAPWTHNTHESEKLEEWLKDNYHVRTAWISVEFSNNKLYVNGVECSEIECNFENPKKLRGDLEPGQCRYTKIIIFENEEDKVKFILKWE